MKLGLLLCLCIGWVVNGWAKPQLVVNYSPSDNAPYVLLTQEPVESGIIVELMQEFARRADIEVLFQLTPRKRLEYSLETGRVHIVVTSNPKWLEQPNNVDWSIPLFDEKNVLVIRRGSSDIAQEDDLKGLTVGTILGYAYPEIEHLFEQGDSFRSDSVEMLHNLTKLRAGRLDAVITSDIQGAWLIQQNGFKSELVFARYFVSQQKLIPAVSKLSPVPLDTINRVFQSMLDDGYVAQLLLKYSG
jgi:polar amino acid transport system substrate-binding protein